MSGSVTEWPVLRSSCDPGSERFGANAAAMAALIDDLRAVQQQTALGGTEAARQRHVERGKLLVRDRIDAVLDPGSPLLELSPLGGTWHVRR